MTSTTVAPVEGGELMLWIQPDGPNTVLYPLGCHGIEDIEESLGAVEQLLCRDLSQPNKWKTIKLSQGTPELIETNIIGDLMCQTADWLEVQECEFSLYLTVVCCGRLDVFDNYERAFLFQNVLKTTNGLTGLNGRVEQSRVEQNFGITISPPVVRAFLLNTVPLTTVSTENTTDVAFLEDVRCASSCGTSRKNCQIGYVVTADNEVYYTLDSGNTLTITTANPFAALEAVASVETFIVGRDTRRVIVVRGTTDALNPGEIAYSDDNGVTWNNVDVGAVNGEYSTNSGSLFALNRFNLWLGATAGFLYYSADGGLTWTAQMAGVLTVNDINAVHFHNDQLGHAGAAGDEIFRTEDGGGVWYAVNATGTGDDIESIATTSDQIWVGTDAGELWFSNDEGVTWTQRSLVVATGGSVTSIKFVDDLVGFVTHTDGAGAGTVHQTINGGYTWGLVTVPTNAGYNSIEACASGLIFFGGDVSGGLGTIARGDIPVSSNTA